ncbi:GGDEF domain-containing protein [Amycolatopsis jiangsuensis]|uniref:Diguanylate cyclase (GGDEF)-like protein n=1 Tax=Amycolatopsis jiangsuensis TaxID=1181879 RepID=A0A840J663_9PSEU|nr:GGDEF domain-containing protein [Amycolatopsis jiangsuensis]MBB4688897.1 diguanylate cyclase (GGDEF)-like protein [Amycolatopsis jiangsuensis]
MPGTGPAHGEPPASGDDAAARPGALTRLRELISGNPVPSWDLWTKPRRMIVFLLSWDVIAIAVLTAGVVTSPGPALLDWGRFGVLAVCATVHIQLTRRQEERRRNRLTAVHIDLSGIWVFPGALLLPIHLTLLLLVIVRGQRWFNSRRPPHKFLFTSFTHAVSALLAHELFEAFASAELARLSPSNSLPVFGILMLVGFCYAALQAIVIGGLLALGGTATPTLRNVLGTKDDNLLELSTIGLGTIATILLVNIPPAIVILVLITVLGNRLAEINQLQSEARTDAKTGISNVRGWSESAERALTRAVRGGESLALLMIDLDHFKWINDTFGHPAGDDVLRTVAQTLDEVTRPKDITGRFGGEEFLVLLPEADATAAKVTAERIRTAIAEQRVVTTDKRGGSALIGGRTASIGVALLGPDGASLDSLLQAADAAVYTAKEGGRNQVRFAESTEPPPAA